MEVLLNLTEKVLFWSGGMCWECAQGQNEEVTGEDSIILYVMLCACLNLSAMYYFVSVHKLKQDKT